MKNIILNLGDLEFVVGGRKHTKEEKVEAKDKYNEMLEKIDTLKDGYHGSISRGSQVYSLLKSYEKQAKKYKRQSKR